MHLFNAFIVVYAVLLCQAFGCRNIQGDFTIFKNNNFLALRWIFPYYEKNMQ